MKPEGFLYDVHFYLTVFLRQMSDFPSKSVQTFLEIKDISFRIGVFISTFFDNKSVLWVLCFWWECLRVRLVTLNWFLSIDPLSYWCHWVPTELPIESIGFEMNRTAMPLYQFYGTFHFSENHVRYSWKHRLLPAWRKPVLFYSTEILSFRRTG